MSVIVILLVFMIIERQEAVSMMTHARMMNGRHGTTSILYFDWLVQNINNLYNVSIFYI